MKYKFPHRIYCLASIIQEVGKISEKSLHYLLYAFCNHYTQNKTYDFVSIKGKPFSFQASDDLSFLSSKGITDNTEGILSITSDTRFARKLNMFEKLGVQSLKNDHIAQNIPEVLCTPHKSAEQRNGFYTIGYEGLSIDSYINKLKENGVSLLCDVRKNAFSQKYRFNKIELSNSLKLCGINYIHLPDLGISSQERQCSQKNANIHNLLNYYYGQLEKGDKKQIAKLIELYNEYKSIAITCFESNVRICHRGKIAKFLKLYHKIDVIDL